jgi:histidyl-tRNA synthetase
MSRTIIEPRTLRGFADVLPEAGRKRREILQVIEEVYASFGFDPIQTPAVEYAEILKGKGGTESDKQMFQFEDQGGRQVALRFDLTVPLARFVAEHRSVLTFPFRAYNIGYVWRGDRPQRGRFREFIQCDADIIGETGISADAEILTIIATALDRVGLGQISIRMNNRRILNGLLETLSLTDKLFPVLRALDKIEKIGPEAVAAELAEAGVPSDGSTRLLAFIDARHGDNADRIAAASAAIGGSAEGAAGIEEVRQVLDLVGTATGGKAPIQFDPSIVRGLDYYTGIVFEVTHDVVREVGAISGGGRYDDLASLYTTARLPGVGGTIGVSRIMALLDILGRDQVGERARPLVIFTQAPADDLRVIVGAATELRAAGTFDVEVYPGPGKHAVQMKYADARSARFTLTLDDGSTLSVKDMRSGARTSCQVSDLSALLTKLADQPAGD